MTTLNVLTTFPTAAPSALGGSTPSVLLSASRGVFQAASLSGSATVALLVWSVALAKWDYVTDPQGPGAHLALTPSSVTGGSESKTFDNAFPQHYVGLLTTSAPNGDTANLTLDLSDASGATVYGRTRLWSKTVAAKSATAVHAAYAGNNATNAFPGPITNPAIPRNLSAVAAAGYDGGALTIVGTRFGVAQTEVITPVAASTVYGVKVFDTVASITKAAVGAAAAAVSVGTGDLIGLDFYPENVSPVAYMLMVAGVTEAASTVAASIAAFTPTTVPAGQVMAFLGNSA